MNFEIEYFQIPSEAKGGPRGFNPRYIPSHCAACGKSVELRVIASLDSSEGNCSQWCVCPCERKEPSVMTTTKDGVSIKHPSVREFRTGKGWPVEISQLFDEASVAHAAGAYTASVMASRKVLMLCACQEGSNG